MHVLFACMCMGTFICTCDYVGVVTYISERSINQLIWGHLFGDNAFIFFFINTCTYVVIIH